MIVGEASSIQSSMFLTIISVTNIFIGWIPVLIFNLSGIETIVWSQIPWDLLMLATFFNIFYNAFVLIAVGVTYPIFVSLGVLFGIPINAIVDAIVRGQSYSVLKIISTLLLVLGFLILLIPLDKAQKISRRMIYFSTCMQMKA